MALAIPEPTFVKGTVLIAKLTGELNVSWEVLKLSRVQRACPVILVSGWIHYRVAKHSLGSVTLIVYVLNVTSLSGCPVRLLEAERGCRLGL